MFVFRDGRVLLKCPLCPRFCLRVPCSHITILYVISMFAFQALHSPSLAIQILGLVPVSPRPLNFMWPHRADKERGVTG